MQALSALSCRRAAVGRASKVRRQKTSLWWLCQGSLHGCDSRSLRTAAWSFSTKGGGRSIEMCTVEMCTVLVLGLPTWEEEVPPSEQSSNNSSFHSLHPAAGYLRAFQRPAAGPPARPGAGSGAAACGPGSGLPRGPIGLQSRVAPLMP